MKRRIDHIVYNAIFDTLLISISFAAAYTISYIATLQRPFISLRNYAFSMFLAVLLFAFSFSFASNILVSALLTFNFPVFFSIIAIYFSIYAMQKTILFAKKTKLETKEKIQRKTKKKYEPRRYFYT